MLRLHVNVDHVATVRQAAPREFPDPVEWALQAESAGVHGITVPPAQGPRHIQDDGRARLRQRLRTLLNLECSLDDEMVSLALASGADAFCLVPENRQEVTTEGGLDVRGRAGAPRARRARARVARRARELVRRPRLRSAGCRGRVRRALRRAAHRLVRQRARRRARTRARAAGARGGGCARARAARQRGHGLDYHNVGPVAEIAGLEELNIGFAIVAHSLSLVSTRRSVG
jgi:pyridoxine 5-phosphate synthase